MTTFNFNKWVLFTSIGWVIGIALVLILLITFEGLKINTGGGQAVIGFGMSAGVGFMQWLLLKQKDAVNLNWMWLSILGFGLPYILFDLLGHYLKIAPETYVPVATGFAGVLAGWLQARFVLRSASKDTWGWTLFNFLGWIVAAVLTFLIYRVNLYIEKHVALFLAIIGLFIGGPILGYITGLKIRALIAK